jgi:hypothetical protein
VYVSTEADVTRSHDSCADHFLPALFPTFRAELTLGNAGDMVIVPGIEALRSAVDTEDN